MMIIFFFIMFSFFTLIFFYNKKLMMMYFQNLMFLLVFLFMINNTLTLNIMKIIFMLFIDFYSFYLILLSIWLIGLMVMSLIKINFMKLYLLNLLIMLISLILTFMSINYFMFYLFFEISMFPTLLLIMGWGGQYERLEASIYMMLYTMFASLPMMIIFFHMFNKINSLNMILLSNMNLINNLYMYIYLILAFLVKMPMFFFHLWLPKAHVEAPISGSMILAGVMLKLGGYGMMRVLMMMESISIEYSYLIMTFSLMGSLYTSLICLQQTDMKMMIAYSSVVHMGMLLSSFMTLNKWGYFGGMIMLIAHGLCSSGLFCLVNFNYERFLSRSLLLNKGMMNIFPSMTLFWFILCSFNMASPPSLNLYSEIMMINSLMTWSLMTLIILMSMSFMSVVYMMFFYSSVQHGVYYKNLSNFMLINKREYLLVILHTAPLFYLIFMF